MAGTDVLRNVSDSMRDQVAMGPSPVDVHVGSRIRMRRVMLGMTQERLGEALGLTFQQVQKYERGVNRVGASRLFDLSRILKVPVGYFFEGMEGEDFSVPDDSDEDEFETAMPALVQMVAENQEAFDAPPTPKGSARLSHTEEDRLLQSYRQVRSAHMRKCILDFIQAVSRAK